MILAPIIQQAFRVARNPQTKAEALGLLDHLKYQALKALHGEPDQQLAAATHAIWGRQSLQALLSRLSTLGQQEPSQQDLQTLLVLIPLICKAL
jgi:hypothetical protein